METVIKLGASAIMASAVCLLLKRSNPEMAVPLAAAVCVGAVVLLSGLLRPVMEVLDSARRLSGLGNTLFFPVLKSVGIAICSRIAADICKDSGQGAMAGCVELGGAVCALYAALPLIEALLDMLEDLV